MDFDGQVAIVTGGASGIGRALGHALAARGAAVVLADIDGAGAAAVAAAIGPRASAHALDVTDAAAVSGLVTDTAARHGRLDLVFNNAGIAVTGDARDLELAHWRRVVEVNLMGVVHGSHAAYRLMAAQGSGHIVNIASLAGLVPFPSNVPYSTTKHAVVGLSRSLRIEGEDLGVRVSVVCPGFVESNIYAAAEAVNLPADDLARDIPFRKVPAEAAARRILDGVLRNEAVIVFPGYARLSWALDRINQRLGLPLARRLIRDLRKLRQVKEVS
ncbi:MAG: SDR family oxidoreductase [Gammaproteobacteria bacterium]|nr:SDR family oxidoreductase [Gammaproteobacteria bacterium]MCP5198742.1 SDR family oxidoreductase [Gammaproteobacteria bacterium]